MPKFRKLSSSQHARFLEYKAALWTAVHTHLEATEAFAAIEVLSRNIAAARSRLSAKRIGYVAQARLVEPLILRQAAALQRADDARSASRKYSDDAKHLLKRLKTSRASS